MPDPRSAVTPLIIALLLATARAPAGPATPLPPRWTPDGTGGGVLRLGGETLLSVESGGWGLRDGSLTLDHALPFDAVALAGARFPDVDLRVDAELTIASGHVAGVVLGADEAGTTLYAALLDAGQGRVRLAWIPWPGKDLQTAEATIERGRAHRMTVTSRRTATGVRIEIRLDDRLVLEHEEAERIARGPRVGFLTHSSRSRFERLIVRRLDETGAPTETLLSEEYEAPPLAGYSLSPASLRADWQDGALHFRARLPAAGPAGGALARIRHRIRAARRVWVPHLAPTDGQVMGDHTFRSPAVVLADGSLALALVPDLDDVGASREAGWKAWLDYEHPEQTLTVAGGDYRVSGGHVLYAPTPLECRRQDIRLRVHVLTSRDRDRIANPYGLAAGWIWERWGRPLHLEGGAQSAPIERYADYIRRWAFSPEGWGDTVWQEIPIGDRACGAPAFIVDVAQHPSVPIEKRRWREQRSVWNQAWFSTQRCANGILRLAQQTDSADLAERARKMTRLALSAPQSDGLFPAVYTTAQPGRRRSYQLYSETAGWDRARWVNSDRRPPDVTEAACHIVDAAFTARLLVEWDEIAGGDAEALAYAERFADRLCRLQRPNGAFPGWVEPDGSVPATLAEGPESAMGTALLLELAARRPDHPQARRWRLVARAALAYLERGPVARARWEDFETYFSCCRWGFPAQVGRLVARNGVFKQNTFSPFWCAEAFLAAHRTLGEDRWLALGRRCLDELSLFQQVWNPPFIAAPCHGGFGVMNCDGEWNDARQSLFAPLYLEYYRETGEPEYFERGVAALRSSFAMLYCPENAQVKRQYELRHRFFGPESYGFMMENIAHGGPAPADGSAIGPFTIFTWGNGAALATAAKIRDVWGDVWIDAERGRAFGVDGCEATVTDGKVEIRDRFGRPSLRVARSSGAMETVPLRDGRATVPLAPPPSRPTTRS